MVHQKILRNDCLITFSPISQEQKFFQIWDLCRNVEKNKNLCRKESVNINDQIFQSIQKKVCFWPILLDFPNFGRTNHSSRKSGSVPIKFICKNFETASDTSGREHQGR